MMERVRRGVRGEAGVTLIEMLIVLALIGILLAVVAPNLEVFFGRGKDRAFQEDQNSMQKASDTYYATYKNSYPTRNTAGATTVTNTAYIDFFRLLSIGKLLTAPQSAGAWNNVSSTGGFGDSPFIGCSTNSDGSVVTSGSCQQGLGSYSWWVDNKGSVHSQNTAGQQDTFNGRYP